MRVYFNLDDGSVRNENDELLGFIVSHSIEASFREMFHHVTDVRFDFKLTASVFSRDMKPQKEKPTKATAFVEPKPARIRRES